MDLKRIVFISLIWISLGVIKESLQNEDEECTILLDKYDRASFYSRNFIAGKTYRWPNATIPYKISGPYSGAEIIKIKSAMNVLETKSCVKFVPYVNQRHYLDIYSQHKGCTSHLGFDPKRKRHLLHLDSSTYCMNVGTIVHEILHALGFAHEHTRPDRNSYIRVNWAEVNPALYKLMFRFAGAKEKPLPPTCNSSDPILTFDNCSLKLRMQTFGLEYDYGSVMHYGLRAASKSGKNTMTTLKAIPFGITIGQRIGPSDLDIRKLKVAYSCLEPTTTTTKKPACSDMVSYCPKDDVTCHFNSIGSLFCRKSCRFCN